MAKPLYMLKILKLYNSSRNFIFVFLNFRRTSDGARHCSLLNGWLWISCYGNEGRKKVFDIGSSSFRSHFYKTFVSRLTESRHRLYVGISCTVVYTLRPMSSDSERHSWIPTKPIPKVFLYRLALEDCWVGASESFSAFLRRSWRWQSWKDSASFWPPEPETLNSGSW